MNIMKKILGYLMILLLIEGLSSCRNELEPLESGNHRGKKTIEKQIMKTISMNFGGDFISETDEPLIRAEDGETYAAINVFRTEKGVENASEEKYAYGLFKKKDGININVLTGFTYRFEATILTEFVDKVFVVNESYAQPFQYNYDQNATGSLLNYHSDYLGDFIYTTVNNNNTAIADNKREYFQQLTSGTANVDVAGDLGSQTQFARISYPRVKRFYGTLESFDPGVSQSVDIQMNYKSFGLKIDVVNLPSGYLTVKDVTRKGLSAKDPTDCLIFSKDLQLDKDTKAEWECIYSLNNLLASSESFNLEFTWHKGGNVTETFTTEITVTPKTRKILRVNINGSPNYETKGNISFVMDTENLTDVVQETYKDFTVSPSN